MPQQIPHSMAEVETALRTWLIVGTGLEIVIQPDDGGALDSEHVVFTYITGRPQQASHTEPRTLEDGSIEACVISDTVVTYQVAIHHCRDAPERLVRLLAYFSTGIWRRTLDTPNLSYIDSQDINRSDYIEDATRRFQTLIDLNFLHRKRICFPYQSIESATLDICVDASDLFEPLTVSKQ